MAHSYKVSVNILWVINVTDYIKCHLKFFFPSVFFSLWMHKRRFCGKKRAQSHHLTWVMLLLSLSPWSFQGAPCPLPIIPPHLGHESFSSNQKKERKKKKKKSWTFFNRFQKTNLSYARTNFSKAFWYEIEKDECKLVKDKTILMQR